MTTYSFEDKEYTYTKSGNNAYIQGTTVYTVPTGKIAKIKFDSFHVSQSSDNTFNTSSVLFYSEGTNIIRKHQFLYNNEDQGDISSMHWYNSADYSKHMSTGGSSATYNYTMSSQNQDWSRNGTIDTTPDSNIQYSNFQSLRGARHLGPDYFYMKSGEVLKVISQLAFPSTPSGNFYGNSRFMVFLEDA